MATGEWRPCCGNCRSEALEVVNDPRSRDPDAQGSQHQRCRDCGALWDGSALTAEEAADRPPKLPPREGLHQRPPGAPPAAGRHVGAPGQKGAPAGSQAPPRGRPPR